VEAIRQKYASEATGRRDALTQESQIQISASKIVEEVGFEKIRQQLAQLQELKIVIVDGLQIAYAGKDGRTIKESCPKIQELDLSRNLFETPQEIMRICIELENLRSLRLK
jgi:tubulin-specific chaperone E